MVLTRSGRSSLNTSNTSSIAPSISTRKRSRETAASPGAPAATPRRSTRTAKKVQSQHRDEMDMSDAEDEQKEQKSGLRRSARLKRRGEVDAREDGGDDVASKKGETDSDDVHQRKKRRLRASSEADEVDDVDECQAASSDCSRTCDSSEPNDSDEDDMEDKDEYINPQDHCYLLRLPLELVLMLFEAIESDAPRWTRAKTLRLLAQTCKAFRRQFWKDLIIDYFDVNFDGDEQRFFFLRDAQKGEFGWQPFFIIYGVECEESTDYDGDVLVSCRSFDPEEYHPKRNVDEYLYVRSAEGDVYIDDCYWEGGPFERDVQQSNFEVFSWKEAIRPRGLVPVTWTLFKQRFTCPECQNTARVVYGSRDLARRWPMIRSVPASYRHVCLCPRCQVTADYAESDQEDSLDEMGFIYGL